MTSDQYIQEKDINKSFFSFHTEKISKHTADEFGISSIKVYSGKGNSFSLKNFAFKKWHVNECGSDMIRKITIPEDVIDIADKNNFDKWYIEISWLSSCNVLSCSIKDDDAIIFSGPVPYCTNKICYFTEDFNNTKYFEIYLYFSDGTESKYTGEITKGSKK